MRIAIVLLMSLCLSGVAAATGGGEAPARHALDIPAQELGSALRSLARKMNFQIVNSSRDVNALRTAGAVGQFTPEEALRKLLDGTGLSFRYLDANTVTVFRPASGASAGSAAEQMRLASVELADANRQRGAAGEGGGADVVVEGRRDASGAFTGANLDLTRTRDDVLPYTVLTDKDIATSGAVDLIEFLGSRLPQNFTDMNETLLDPDGTAPLNDRIDLRGWGASETLLLLNGRRMGKETQDTFGDSTGRHLASLRAIPLASIERIEILTSAGSAIYGASATGGVINIITRREFSGGQFNVSYETPSDVLRPRRNLSFTYGHALPWGWGLRATGGYNDSEPMRVGDRADRGVERYRQLALERAPSRLFSPVNGNMFQTSTNPIFGATPNIRGTSNTANLFSGVAGMQASNFTTVPDGYTGGSDPAAFTPGVYNVELADARGSPVGLKSRVGTATENTFIGFGLDRRFGADWDWSIDARWSENRAEGMPSTGLNFTSASALNERPRVPAGASINPFGQAVNVALIDVNLDRPELVNRPKNATWELSSTLRGQMGRWRGFLDVSVSENRARSQSFNFFEPIGGWTAAFNSSAYNPFVDTRVMSPAAPAFYERYLRREVLTDNTTRNYGAALKGSGPVYTLPAGPLQLTGGLDWAQSELTDAEVAIQYRNSETGELGVPAGGIPFNDSLILGLAAYPGARLSTMTSSAAYAEAVIPLVSAAQNLRFLNSLELFGSGRVDRMDYRGDAGTNGAVNIVTYETTSTLSAFGLRFRVTEDVMVRLSRSSGVKAPSLGYLTPGSPPTRDVEVLDPVRNETRLLTTDMYVTGGNPDVKPESTTSSNIGLILTPKRVPGLRLSLDYLESVRDDAIYTVSAADALALEQDMPWLVTRAAPDGHPSGVGPITFIDQRYTNLRRLASRSVDIHAEQRIGEVSGGTLLFTLAATRNLSFKVQGANTAPSVEQVRNPRASLQSQQLKWNGNAQLRWEGAQWSYGWSARYFDYLLVNDSQAINLQFQGRDRAPRAFNHDLNISYRAPATGGSGLANLAAGAAFTLGVKNVFDRTPRFWYGSASGIAPYDGGTLMGRTLWFQMRKDFGN